MKNKYNFDEIIERRGTSSLKYDCAERFGRPKDALPLWVADMDFSVPLDVTKALENHVSHGIYGYTESDANYFNAVENWFKTYHNYKIEEPWVVKTPGVVFALGMAIKAFTEIGDKILIQKPLYYPIENSIVRNNRIVVDNTLVYKNGCYTIDMADFEEKISKNNVRMFILCNPHNPVGRVWTKDELAEMGRICKKYNCLVVSDEIHCDLVFNNHIHLPFATVDDNFVENSIILTAPSKTFNLAGLQVSNVFIPDKKLRNAFKHEIIATGYSQLNTLGLIACSAAYIHGYEWLIELKEYLLQNANYVIEFFAKHLPQVKVIPLEGTYLMWLDFNSVNLTHSQMQEVLDTAKVWLSSGTSFGATGEGFWRINIACPKSTIETALNRIINVINNTI